MKLIEALKGIKDLQKKADDLREKIGRCAADLDVETPLYENQKGQVKGWLQAHSDIVKEILRLRIAIQRTNLATDVTIELSGKSVTKTIAEWVHRRRDLAALELSAWKQLTDRGLKEGHIEQTDQQKIKVSIVRCYDPEEKDNKIALYDSEPLLIDAKLEIANAVTDLIEDVPAGEEMESAS